MSALYSDAASCSYSADLDGRPRPHKLGLGGTGPLLACFMLDTLPLLLLVTLLFLLIILVMPYAGKPVDAAAAAAAARAAAL